MGRSSWRARALAGIAAVAAAGVAGPIAGASASITTYPNEGTGAYVSFPDFLSGSTLTASTFVRVPTVTCTGVAADTIVGQSYYVDLNDTTGLEILADVRGYCDGSTPAYAAEFITPDGSDPELFTPGSITVSAGNLVRLSVTGTATTTTASVFDVSTFRSAKVTGTNLGADVIGFVGTQGLQSDGSGGLLTSGPLPSDAGTLAGPVASTAALETGTLIDGQGLGSYDSANDLGLDTWENSDGEDVVAVSPFVLDTWRITVTNPTTGGSGSATAGPLAG